MGRATCGIAAADACSVFFDCPSLSLSSESKSSMFVEHFVLSTSLASEKPCILATDGIFVFRCADSRSFLRNRLSGLGVPVTAEVAGRLASGPRISLAYRFDVTGGKFVAGDGYYQSNT